MRRRRSWACTVTYERGASSVEVQATIGQTVFRLNDDPGGGATIRDVSRDYLIRTADLVLDGETRQPQRGDRILEEVSGKDAPNRRDMLQHVQWAGLPEAKHSGRGTSPATFADGMASAIVHRQSGGRYLPSQHAGQSAQSRETRGRFDPRATGGAIQAFP